MNWWKKLRRRSRKEEEDNTPKGESKGNDDIAIGDIQPSFETEELEKIVEDEDPLSTTEHAVKPKKKKWWKKLRRRSRKEEEDNTPKGERTTDEDPIPKPKKMNWWKKLRRRSRKEEEDNTPKGERTTDEDPIPKPKAPEIVEEEKIIFGAAKPSRPTDEVPSFKPPAPEIVEEEKIIVGVADPPRPTDEVFSFKPPAPQFTEAAEKEKKFLEELGFPNIDGSEDESDWDSIESMPPLYQPSFGVGVAEPPRPTDEVPFLKSPAPQFTEAAEKEKKFLEELGFPNIDGSEDDSDWDSSWTGVAYYEPGYDTVWDSSLSSLELS